MPPSSDFFLNSILTPLLNGVATRWLPITGLVLVVITTLSLTPLPQLPDVPGNDKTHHLVAYAALAFPIALRGYRSWLWLVALCLVWSAGIELVQPYVNRYGEWMDLLANGIGLFIGVAAGALFRAKLPLVLSSNSIDP